MDYNLLIFLIAAFLLGSIPSGFIIGKLYGVDIRKHGSGNIGATNASRVLGKKAGLVTLIADFVKGILAVMLGAFYSPDTFGLPVLFANHLEAVLGLLALLGHCYSPFLSFRGGKGVATGCAVFFALAPIQTAISVSVFGLCLKLSKYVSLSSILAAATVPLLLFFSPAYQDKTLAYIASIAAAVIIYRHKENISRLIKGTEVKLR